MTESEMSDPASDYADEVVRRLKIIDKWYSPLQSDSAWMKLKNIHPKAALAVLELRDRIDDAWGAFRREEKTWEQAEKAIDDYAARWIPIQKQVGLYVQEDF